VQAVIINEWNSHRMPEVLVLDVTSLSLGIETPGEVMAVLIERNSMLPAKKIQTFTTYADHQPAVTIKVFEGVRPRTRDNILLGTFDLTGIPPAPRGVPQIEVTFDVNADGSMNVSAKDKLTGNVKMITIKSEKERLSRTDIDRMVAEAEKFRLQDEEWKKKVEAEECPERLLFQSEEFN
jgi:L1 cell adhesion molecule like protein